MAVMWNGCLPCCRLSVNEPELIDKQPLFDTWQRLFFRLDGLLKVLFCCCQLTVREAQLSSRDPRDALYQLNCWPTVLQMTQTDRVSARRALSATATFYSATCVVLYTHRCSKISCRTAIMRCSVSHTRNAEVSRACDQQSSTQPTFLVSTGP